MIVTLQPAPEAIRDNVIEVSMPLGLYTSNAVTAPCGICSTDGIIGLLDVPETYMDPERMKTSLLWFTSGFVEYQFPNNAKLRGELIRSVDVVMEVSSEVPGRLRTGLPTSSCRSTVLKSVCGHLQAISEIVAAPTPAWWKLQGSQYGMLKTWSVGPGGTFVDGHNISDVRASDLGLNEHRSVRLRVEVKADSKHPGGINIFGRGFGNYDQDILLRLKPSANDDDGTPHAPASQCSTISPLTTRPPLSKYIENYDAYRNY